MVSFLEWLIGEAGAAWILGILGLVGVVYTWLKRERPPRVIFQEVNSTQLLGISATTLSSGVYIRTQKGQNIPIEGLTQKEYVVYNSGTLDITEPVSLLVKLTNEEAESSERVIEVAVDDSSGYIVKEDNKPSPTTVGIRVELPYLNSFARHKHYVRTYVISDHEIDLQAVTGMGKGWSAYPYSPYGSSGEVERFRINWTRALWLIGQTFLLLGFSILIFVAAQNINLGTVAPPILGIIRPTPEMIDEYLRSERERLELILTLTWWEAVVSPMTKAPFARNTLIAIFGGVIMYIGAVVRAFHRRMAIYVTEQVYGVQPNSSFGRNE